MILLKQESKMTDLIDKYKQTTSRKLENHTKFPLTFNLTRRMECEFGDGDNWELNDELLELLNQEFKDYTLTLNSYICGGENDPTVEDYMTISRV